MTTAAVRLGQALRYRGVGTVELLVDLDAEGPVERVSFIEANARIQVEHTVTEEVTGVDLVQIQLRLAGGAGLAELGLDQATIRPPRGIPVQPRLNAERLLPDGTAVPATGTITAYEPPGGPGVRVDGWAFAGATLNPRYDSLLAKVVGRVPTDDLAAALRRTARAVGELRVDGVTTNAALVALLEPAWPPSGDDDLRRRPPDRAGRPTEPSAHATRFGLSRPHRRRGPARRTRPRHGGAQPPPEPDQPPPRRRRRRARPLQARWWRSSSRAHLVHTGQPLLVMEARRWSTSSPPRRRARVGRREATPSSRAAGLRGALDGAVPEEAGGAGADLDRVRPDLGEVLDRHAVGLDPARPDMVARRRATGQRTARENVDDLCDPGTFVEYGPLVIAAQRRRRSVDDLIARTPADGLVSGSAVSATCSRDRARAQCRTTHRPRRRQGLPGHRKKDRLFELAERWRLPVVFFPEGGGGRPGDTDAASGVAGLDCMAFHLWGRLSGLVPLVGITSGRCFAGNAALLGCCDVVIATADSTIGMAAPP
jgi:hypothetical protein